MKAKKLLCLILAIFILTISFTSCKSISENPNSETIATSPNQQFIDTENINNNSDNSYNKDTFAPVYNKYSNLVNIGPFYNGIANFQIEVSTYDNRYGYIDINGNVIIEPIYRVYKGEKHNFEYNYVDVQTLDGQTCIIDKQGKIIFEEDTNNITVIGKVQNGYFFVETVEELFSGNIYTVKYYSVKDLSVVATFQTQRSIWSNYSQALISDIGEATINQQTFNIADYDNSFTPKINNWNVEIKELDIFSSVRDLQYTISSSDNDLGQIATVAIQNQNRVNFFSIVDKNGNIIHQPQQNPSFLINDENIYSMSNAEFRKNLCPAKDVESNLWGYIDPHGNWKIEPQYTSAKPFSPDGYATVNETIVIDTTGNTIFSPYGGDTEFVYGTYTRRENDVSWSLTFDENGELSVSGGHSKDTVNYEIRGNVLILHSGIRVFYNGVTPGLGMNPGEFIYKIEDNILTINGIQWKFYDPSIEGN